MFPGNRRQEIDRVADAHFNAIREPRRIDVLAGNFRMLRINFETDQATVGCQRAGKPYGAVAAERPDLENSACAGGAGEELDQPALIGRDRDLRQSGFPAPPKCAVERSIMRRQ